MDRPSSRRADADARGDRAAHERRASSRRAALLRLRPRSSWTTLPAVLAALHDAPAERRRSRVTARSCAPARSRCAAHPRLNAVWTEEGLLEADEVNVGVAIALDDGLVAPALLGADRLDVAATAAALARPRRAGARAAAAPAEISDATFTLSNLGMFDVTRVHRDHDAAAGRDPRDGAPGRALVLGDGGCVRRAVLTATLSADHRARRRRRRGAISGDVQAGDRGPRDAPAGAERRRRRR